MTRAGAGTGAGHDFTLCGAALTALPSGALLWRDQGLLVVSDLHLGRSARYARRAGALLPPYEVAETLARLEGDITASGAHRVISLGDAFDDMAAAGIAGDQRARLMRLMEGRRWIWISGNHDPGPTGLGGQHQTEARLGPLVFRHIAEAGARGEVSGHYHPKARLAGRSRPCFLVDDTRAILPAYGSYTGGLASDSPALAGLMAPGALAILTGALLRPIPMPR